MTAEPPMLPAYTERRRAGLVALLTFAAVILQILAYVAVFKAALREARTVDAREAAIERIVTHIDAELTTLESAQGKGK